MRAPHHAAWALVIALGISVGCTPRFQVDCGRLEPAACQARVAEIESVVVGEFPGRRIVWIRIVNDEGHAMVRLDDGTEIGFGERLGSAR
jgi:hypothetical protein